MITIKAKSVRPNADRFNHIAHASKSPNDHNHSSTPVVQPSNTGNRLVSLDSAS